MEKRRIIVAMTGASGAVLGIRLLQELRSSGAEIHLILSEWAQKTIALETGYTVTQVQSLAHAVYPVTDMAAGISSGSFQTEGMAVVPCSMKTLAAIANGFSCNLIARAADVTLKERRRLLLVPRETPLSSIHLRNMLTLTEAGAMLLPPCVGFYARPQTLEDAVDHLVGKILDGLGIPQRLYRQWEGAAGPIEAGMSPKSLEPRHETR
ncbi:MAG: UbiX family flavin prenyltransferase [Oscillibacter sp.]|nr:UbiX family flavin prenyltransferase [Oscillibacter sp.]